MRARRGEAQDIPAVPAANLRPGGGRYVALYDISSEDIDKTIIHMLMASWGMEKSHHSTDLLKVTERVYFQQIAVPRTGTSPGPGDTEDFLYLVRIACCRDHESEAKFNSWYDRTYLPVVLQTPGFVKATRYHLYWVLMDEPVKVPPFLTVFEIKAPSAERALEALRGTAQKLSQSGQISSLYVEEGSAIFRKIKDVAKQ